ncbi:hypothetical protein CCE29_12100 [Lacticaseibacillus rhamnosus]|nr:hypothetical protein CCE29_12100 [Lacticaseibacillus rhamnosus]RXU48408.1 hypothetical protein CYG42_13550 [Lacticaseibacillus rhamnosus]RXU52901.1 hypothetical protein CYG43_14430 [Lacticaseibacillus rhamnosus]RXU61541.1 hypothetical protein CYG45_14130 [Lacticaseibacillus rhamnosus]
MISDTPSWLRGGWAGTWWARLRTRKDRGFEARPWSKAEKPTPLKTNFTTEPATAPPALTFYFSWFYHPALSSYRAKFYTNGLFEDCSG